MPKTIKVLEVTRKKNQIQKTISDLIIPEKLILPNTRSIALLDKTKNRELLEINHVQFYHHDIQELMNYFIENSKKLSYLLDLIKLFIETGYYLTIYQERDNIIKIDFHHFIQNKTLNFSSYEELNDFIKNNVFYEKIEFESVNLITFKGEKDRLNKINDKLIKIVKVLDLDTLYIANKYELINIDDKTDEEILDSFLSYLYINSNYHDVIKNLVTLKQF
jgi:hypothetical protein